MTNSGNPNVKLNYDLNTDNIHIDTLGNFIKQRIKNIRFVTLVYFVEDTDIDVRDIDFSLDISKTIPKYEYEGKLILLAVENCSINDNSELYPSKSIKIVAPDNGIIFSVLGAIEEGKLFVFKSDRVIPKFVKKGDTLVISGPDKLALY